MALPQECVRYIADPKSDQTFKNQPSDSRGLNGLCSGLRGLKILISLLMAKKKFETVKTRLLNGLG